MPRSNEKVEPETDNCLEMLEQMSKDFPVAAQRSKQTITAVMAESQGDHRLFMEYMFQILAEDFKKIQENIDGNKTIVSINPVDLPKEISEPSPI